jgi:exodeoxyribonuclease-1
MFPVANGCLALIWPLGMHPTNKNEVIAWDLAYDPSELAGMDADSMRQRMFTKREEMPEGMSACRSRAST